MKYLSVCSGIEAATCAWHSLGWQPFAFSEIEAFPSAVLAHHYPDVPNLGDMTKFKEWPDATIDLLVGGTPCQSFSIAGLRKGLDDPRGNLMLTYLAIADKYRPRWLVWENVPGVLSSGGGRDFACLLRGMGELGYGFAYRVLDAQFFGVPQRRRRVFVVGHLGDWRRAAAVLFERHSLQGHPAPRREARQGVARPIASSSRRGSGYRNDADTADNLIPETVGTLCDGAHMGGGLTGRTLTAGESLPSVAMCLNAGAMGRQDAESETLIPTIGGGFDVAHSLRAQSQPSHRADSDTYVAHSLRGEGFDASEDGTGRGTPLIPIPFDTTQITSAENGSNPQPGDPCHPLARGAHAPAIAFDCKASGQNGFGVGEIASTLRSMGHAHSHQNGGGHQAVAYSTKLHNTSSNQAGKFYEEYTAGLDANSPAPAVAFQSSQSGVREGECHATLDSNNGSRRHNGVVSGMQVRRLTPRECERLQGFEDDYTNIPWRKSPTAPDGPRYKALGNSMAVPVMHWIGERIDMVEQITSAKEAA